MQKTMRLALRFSVFAGLALLACASEEGALCERLAECHELPEGLTESECEEQSVQQVPEDRLEKCADCALKEDCKDLVDACRKYCEPGD